MSKTPLNPNVKCVIAGPPGAGKTTLATTLPPDSVFLISMESGLLSITGNDEAGNPLFRGHIEECRTWRDLRHLIVWIAGPNPNTPDNEPLSAKHYEHAVKMFGGEFKTKFPAVKTIFLDSLTEASRLCRAHCETLPEAKSKSGQQDTRAVYGLIKDEMLGLLGHLRHAPFNIALVGILERKTDALGDEHWGLQLEGQATGKALSGLVDEVFVIDTFRVADGDYRALITSKPNKWDFEAKDRSGTLNKAEAPDLGAVFAKIAAGKRAKPLQRTIPSNLAV